MTPASIIPVFGSQRPYADLNFAGGSFGLDGRSVSDITRLPGFTFTRASLAMGYDATGKLVYGPNNLLVQSQTFGNALWVPTGASIASDTTTAPDGTLTADTLIEDTSGSAHRLLPAVGNAMSFGIGAGMVGSLYVKSAGRSHAFIRINNSGGDIAAGNVRLADGVVTQTTSGTISAQVLANGWVRIAAYGVSANPAANTSAEVRCSNSDIYANYTGDGTSGLHIWGFQLEAVTYQTTPSTYYPTTTAAYYGPRFVYDPVTLASQGILVEEARTNLALQSQTFSTTWVTADGVLTANTALAPDGTTTADKLVGTAASAAGRLVQSFTGSIGATYTLSCYVKSAGGTLARLYFDDNGSNSASVIYNSITGAVSTAAATTGGNWTAASSAAQQLGDGWWRFSLTFTATAVAPTRVALWHRDVSDGTNGLLFWQAQLEAAVGASSPIPTTTAAVTRAADVASLGGLSLSYPLSVVGGFIRTIGSSTGRVSALTIDGGNLTALGLNSALQYSLRVAAGGSFTAQIDGAVTTYGAPGNIAGRFQTDNAILAAQGVLTGPDTSTTMPAVSPTLYIGSLSGSSEFMNGTISRIRIYNRALPDAQLQSLTT